MGKSKITKMALMPDVEQVLRDGGFIRFTWANGNRELITKEGVSHPLDGRTYQAVLKMNLRKTSIGSTENRDLVLEWRP